MRTRIGIALFCLLSLIAAACGNGDSSDERADTVSTNDDDEANGDGEDENGDGEDENGDDGDDSDEGDETDEPTITEVDLPGILAAEALLTIYDLRPGYSVAPPEEGGGTELTQSPCGYLDPSALQGRGVADPIGQADVGFVSDGFGRLVAQGVAIFPSAVDAELALDVVAGMLQECAEFQEVQDDGTVLTFRYSPMPFDQFGARTLAVGMEIHSDLGFAGSGGFVLFRRANVVESLIAFGLVDAADMAELAEVVETADNRLVALMEG